MQVLLVGGAIRDELLGLAAAERDWVVIGATAAALESLGYQRVGHDFPVFLHPQTREEHALARTERKRGPGHKGFEMLAAPEVTLEQDLQRRDLTINAMARGADGVLVDPYGGQRDLTAKLLRHISPAFIEDPLRVLRVARFAAKLAPLGFSVAPETMSLMRAVVASGELATLPAERVWTELAKALATDRPSVFVQVLRDCGALAVLLPELDALFGVPQPAAHHPEIDSGVHTLMVLDQAARLSADLEVRYAALLHDLGKGTTPADMLPKHHGHEQRGAKLVTAVSERLRAPRAARELAEHVAHHHLIVHRALELRPDTTLDLIEKVDGFRRPERFAQFLTACEADARGRLGLETRDYPQRARLEAAFTAARSVDAAAIVAAGVTGPEVAKRLRAARVAAIAAIDASSRP